MKSFIKLLLIFFSFGLCQQSQPDTQKPINTIKSEKNSYYEFEEKHGDFREVLESDIIYIYDSEGNKIELVNYDAKGIWCQKLFTKAPWIIQCGFSPPIALKRIATKLISVDVSHPANLRGFFISENL